MAPCAIDGLQRCGNALFGNCKITVRACDMKPAGASLANGAGTVPLRSCSCARPGPQCFSWAATVPTIVVPVQGCNSAHPSCRDACGVLFHMSFTQILNNATIKKPSPKLYIRGTNRYKRNCARHTENIVFNKQCTREEKPV